MISTAYPWRWKWRWDTTSLVVLNTMILFLVRFTDNYLIVQKLVSVFNYCWSPSTVEAKRIISSTKIRREIKTLWSKHPSSTCVCAQRKGLSSSIKIPKSVGERRQPYFTHMVLRILSKSPWKDRMWPIIESYNQEITIRSYLDMLTD